MENKVLLVDYVHRLTPSTRRFVWTVVRLAKRTPLSAATILTLDKIEVTNGRALLICTLGRADPRDGCLGLGHAP